jgi:ankyrin repeat protein
VFLDNNYWPEISYNRDALMKLKTLCANFLLCIAFGAKSLNASAVEDFLGALQAGEILAAKAMLNEALPVNKVQVDGTSALHWAVYHQDVELVDWLLEHGADVSVSNDFGSTPLAQASILANARIIELLLEAGADPNERGQDGQTPLMVVARTSNTQAAKILLEGGANVNAIEEWRGQTALMWAAAQRQKQMVELLLSAGAEVDVLSTRNNWERQVTAEPRMKILPPGGMSALMYAAREGCADCVRSLMAAGADPNLADPQNVTPLVFAGLNAKWDSMVALIEAGADVNKWDYFGRNPLYTVVDYNTLPHGGRPDHLSSDLTKPMEVAELLVSKGANVNLQLKLFPPYRALGPDRGADGLLRTGATPLFRASRGGDLPMVEFLLKAGALVDLPQENEVTPLIVAAGYRASPIDTRGRFRTEEQALAVVQALLEAGADVNYQTEVGQTAIFGAATNGWNHMVELLVTYGADLNIKDLQGNTALDAALGKAGLFGRGSGGDLHQETADLITKLMQ